MPDDAGRYRALIVDDERLARVGLRAMLTAHPEFVFAGEASNGSAAAAAIQSLAPDVVFLDIQMPERDGFRVLAELPPYERPAIVFVTAHRQYALEAFGVNAVDYLLKPCSRQRFALAVRRVLRFLRGAEREVPQPANDLDTNRDTDRIQRLAVRDRDRLVFIEPADVPWFEVYGNYVRLAVGDRKLLLHSTLSAVAARLDPHAFLRISRSILVNVRHVRSIKHNLNGQHDLIMMSGDVLHGSRRYRADIRKMFTR